MKTVYKLMCVFAITSCGSESEQEIKPVKVEAASATTNSGSNASARFDNSDVLVAGELIVLGYSIDSLDDNHYYYNMGGSYNVTIHVRGDSVIPDKYKILYESTEHVGEELLFNGYITSVPAWYSIVGMINFDILV